MLESFIRKFLLSYRTLIIVFLVGSMFVTTGIFDLIFLGLVIAYVVYILFEARQDTKHPPQTYHQSGTSSTTLLDVSVDLVSLFLVVVALALVIIFLAVR